MKRLLPIATALLAPAWLPALAQAHVTLQPPQAPTGAYTVLDVRVPNEQDGATTTEVRVQLPSGFVYAATQPVPGWRARVIDRKLDRPIKVEGVDVDEEVSQLVFTATGKGVRPDEFQDFPVSLKLPDGKPGDKLTFKALQTYSNGDIVRWIGSPDSDHPAPQVTLTQPTTDAAVGSHTGSTQVQSRVATATTDDGGEALAVVALIVGALGVLIGVAGLALARRARR